MSNVQETKVLSPSVQPKPPTQDTTKGSNERSEHSAQPVSQGASSSAPIHVSQTPAQDSTRPSNETSERSIQPILQAPSSPAPIHFPQPQVSRQEPSSNLAPSIPSQPSTRPVSQATSTAPIVRLPAPPPRAIQYDQRAHVDDGHTAAGHGHGPVRRTSGTLHDVSSRRTTLPPLPVQGDASNRTSPDEMRSPEFFAFGRMPTANTRSQGTLDYIVPQLPLGRDENLGPRSIKKRIEPTITEATNQRAKFAATASLNGYLLNFALGLQVLLGALTTGLAAVTTGRQTSIVVSVLGGMTTLVASYLARVRGSGEPEYSTGKVKDLDHFIRECRAFELDHGHEMGGGVYDAKLVDFRERLEDLLNDT
ncbi:hypothetical protein AAF712_010580 [Marasmius tenuissimus]|uniref:SMODS and SLOG-associating 2TM effector domain-containing protein n=1 Tax=Marasmius tenuissimus TaxID=585030 RepID=A0ABR2ZLG7_9AGAR